MAEISVVEVTSATPSISTPRLVDWPTLRVAKTTLLKLSRATELTCWSPYVPRKSFQVQLEAIVQEVVLQSQRPRLDRPPNNSPQVPGLLTSVPPTANCPFTLGSPTTVYVHDCSGRRPPNAPEWVFAFGIQQAIPLGDTQIVLNADTRYQSEIFAGLEYLPPQLDFGDHGRFASP